MKETVINLAAELKAAVTGKRPLTPQQTLVRHILETIQNDAMAEVNLTDLNKREAEYRHLMKLLETSDESAAKVAWFKQNQQHSEAFRSGRAAEADTISMDEWLARNRAKIIIAQQEIAKIQKELANIGRGFYTKLAEAVELYLIQVQSNDRAQAEKFGLPNVPSPMVQTLQKLLGMVKTRATYDAYYGPPAELFSVLA